MFTDLHSLLRNISAVAFISDVLQFCDCLPIMHILAFASFKAVRERKFTQKEFLRSATSDLLLILPGRPPSSNPQKLKSSQINAGGELENPQIPQRKIFRGREDKSRALRVHFQKKFQTSWRGLVEGVATIFRLGKCLVLAILILAEFYQRAWFDLWWSINFVPTGWCITWFSAKLNIENNSLNWQM